MSARSPDQALDLRRGSPPPGKPPAEGMVWIPGGTFLMGSNDHYPEEAPAHTVTVSGFWMDRYAVTNAEFRRFVEATGYVTLAERPANPADYPGAKPELLVPSSVVFRKTAGPVDLRNPHNWWTYVRGADWRHPRGPGQHAPGALEASGRARRLRGRRGLCEMGGQGAADRSRVGVRGARRARRRRVRLGRRVHAGRQAHGNTWQGEFPWQNLLQRRLRVDRAGRLVSAERLRAVRDGGQRLGVDDRLVPGARQDRAGLLHARRTRVAARPSRATTRARPNVRIPRKVMKGGSYLCAPNYCRRYRPAARMAQPVDTSIGHLGFRCIVRAPA